MHISFLRGDLPPASLMFFFTGLWGFSRWRRVQAPSLRDRADSDQGPRHLAVLTGSSLNGDPQWTRTTSHARTATSVGTLYAGYVPARHFTDGDVALLTEQAHGGVRQV